MKRALIGIRYIFKKVIIEFSGDAETAIHFSGDVEAWAALHLKHTEGDATDDFEKVESFDISEPIGTPEKWCRHIDRKTQEVTYS